jgi:hypothetical protein
VNYLIDLGVPGITPEIARNVAAKMGEDLESFRNACQESGYIETAKTEQHQHAAG